MAIDKNKYLLARANNLLEKFRGDEISRLVRKKYSFGAETRILYDFVKAPDNPEYLAKFKEHEDYVTECKAKVDADIERVEAEQNPEFI